MSDNEQQPEKKKRSKSFKSIDEILNIAGGETPDLDFNSEETEEMQAKIDIAKQEVNNLKTELARLKNLPDEEYQKSILKNLVDRAMTMLASVQLEIEDNPNGRALETAASMVSAINSIMDNYNKILTNNERLKMDKDKFEFKKMLTQNQAGGVAGIASNGTTNQPIFIGTSTDIVELLASKGIQPPGSYQKPVKETTATVIKADKSE